MTSAQPGVPATRSRVRATGLLVHALLVAMVMAACGTSTTSPSPSASATPSPSSSGGPAPRATPWTGNAALGIEAMGLADGEIRKGMNDFNAGVQAGDPARMLKAARGLSGVDILLDNADKVEPFEPMRAFAASYREAIGQMASAAKALRAALEAGDSSGTTTASQKLIDSFTKYAAIQSQLAEWVVQLPEQKRILVR